MAEVIDTGDVDLEEPLLIEGFPGVGLVGTIATQYLYDNLELEQVAKIGSEDFPPVAVIKEGTVKLPVRVYKDAEHETLLVVSELPIHPAIANDVAEALVSWGMDKGARELVSIAGLGTMDSGDRVFGVATDEELLDSFPEEVEVFSEGNVSGITGSILVESSVRGLDAICLLGETQLYAPDPRAASSAIAILNEIYGFGVDTSELLEQADQIESQMRRLAERTKKAHEEGEQEAPTPWVYG